MYHADDLLAAIAPLSRADLDIWIREELIEATREGDRLVFSDMQCARVRLLCTLRFELDVETDSLPLVMSLLDQLYETRAKLLALGQAVSALDPALRERVLASLS